MTKKIIPKKLNSKGQSLVEYLVLVAVMAIGSIAVVKTLGTQLNVSFARVAESLGADSKAQLQNQEISESQVKKKDLSNFFQGSRNRNSSSESSNNSSSKN